MTSLVRKFISPRCSEPLHCPAPSTFLLNARVSLMVFKFKFVSLPSYLSNFIQPVEVYGGWVVFGRSFAPVVAQMKIFILPEFTAGLFLYVIDLPTEAFVLMERLSGLCGRVWDGKMKINVEISTSDGLILKHRNSQKLRNNIIISSFLSTLTTSTS